LTLLFSVLMLTGNASADEPPAFLKPPHDTAQQVPQDALLERVLAIVEDKCAFAGCHTGANAPKNLDMSEEVVVANLVGVKSVDGPWMRVKPGDPANSYMVKKIRGTADIKGDRMPRGSRPLPEAEIAAIEAWIKSLPAEMKVEAPKQEYARAFPGVTLTNLQTAETLDKGAFLYRIAHRFKAPTNVGFDQFFGLDAGARMMGQLSFPFSDALMFTVARQGLQATFEFNAKWRLLREKTDGSMPLSVALLAGLDWKTLKQIADPNNPTGDFLDRTASERFAYFAQLPVTKQLGNNLSVAVVPGVLLNGNINMTDEDPLVTIGLAGKFSFNQTYGIYVEAVPIVAGDETANPIIEGSPNLDDNGNPIFYDTFTTGLEIKAGGHVFHIFISNSSGNTTGQYMSGGDLDFFGGDFRLGFNIYRILNYPF
jgi:hypothetical protein